MPGKYKFNDDNSSQESCYESEGETEYCPEKTIGSGVFAIARKFQSVDGQRAIAVLKPKDPDDVNFHEVNIKYNFFKAIYPDHSIKLIEKKDYRLVLPFIAGIPYKKLNFSDKKEQVELFISAIEALKDCHNKGYIVMDLKKDNIHYDIDSGKSYLLDGGHSVKENKLLDPKFYFVDNDEDLISNKDKYPQVAPECWSKKPVPAKKNMDVYALGIMMRSLFKLNPFPDISNIIQSCLAIKPEHRPTLDELQVQLKKLLLQLRNQQKDAPSEKRSSNEKTNYVHSLKILADQSIELTKRQQKRLRINNKIQKAIVDFNYECTQFYAIHNRIKDSSFSNYKRETLALMIRGPIEFKKEYYLIEQRVNRLINSQAFKKFTKSQATSILATLNSSKTELATTPTLNKSRDRFFLFQDPLKIPASDGVKKCALQKIEKPNHNTNLKI